MPADAAVALVPDSMIGAYRIIREIGRGGMATVYEAQHTVLPRRAAVKVMHSELRRHPGMATRLVQEASILEDIRHPGIVRVYECNLLPDHRPWIAMELVEGDTLAARLVRCSSLPPAEIARLLGDVADVLSAVHARGIVHRDLKPENLLLPMQDKEFPLRVIDWGVARMGPVGRITVDGLTPGTPIYMSPEQACGKNIAAPCDIYSLGVIAYEALTGAPPFDGRSLVEVVSMHLTAPPPPLRERCPTAPIELCALIHRMLDKDPARRPTASDVRHTCRALAAELATVYEEFELIDDTSSDVPVGRAALGKRTRMPALHRPAAAPAPSADTVVVDPEALEYGATQLVPSIRKPRWTPDVGYIQPPAAAATAPRKHAITPNQNRAQVSGEIIDRRR